MAAYQAEHRNAVVNGLRALADFWSEHPDMPVPRYPELTVNVIAASDEEERAEVDRIAGILGVTPTLNATETHYRAQVTFGPLEVTVVAITEQAMAQYSAGAWRLDAAQPRQGDRAVGIGVAGGGS